MDPAFEGVPQFDTNEFSAGESGGQTKQTDNTFQFSEAYSIIHGTHQFKFGGEGNYVQVIERRITDPNGAFDFGGNETGDDLADFLIGAIEHFYPVEQPTAGFARMVLRRVRTRYVADQAELHSELRLAARREHVLLRHGEQDPGDRAGIGVLNLPGRSDRLGFPRRPGRSAHACADAL